MGDVSSEIAALLLGALKFTDHFVETLDEVAEHVGVVFRHACGKVACFNRYQTIDVVRAITNSGRGDIALYTGNDDNIVVDLLTTYRIDVGGKRVRLRIVGLIKKA